MLNSQSFQCNETIEASRVPDAVLELYSPNQSNDLHDLGSYLTYVGCILVRRELWLSTTTIELSEVFLLILMWFALLN